MEKYCNECNSKKELNEENFHKRKDSKDKFDHLCKICRKKRNLNNYYKSHEKWRNTHTKTRLLKKQKIQEIKENSLGCLKCGEKKHYLLDFHHLDPKTKKFQLSQGETKGWNIIEEEIKKCILICSNCHREFHHFQKLNNITIEDYLKSSL